MAVVVVDEAEFGVIELAGPLDGLLHIPCGGYLPIGGVCIGVADVAGGAVEFADVLRQIPAVCEPGAVLLDGQRAGGGDVRRRHRAVAGAFRAIVIHRQSAEVKPRSLTKTDLHLQACASPLPQNFYSSVSTTSSYPLFFINDERSMISSYKQLCPSRN